MSQEYRNPQVNSYPTREAGKAVRVFYSTLMKLPTFADVQRAATLLIDVVHNTPIHTSCQLNTVSQARVFLKCENFQRVGAFKFRGAYNAVANCQGNDPVIAVSSGNHAQGIALACQLLGREAHLVMPKPVNPLKLAAVKGYGGLVYAPETREEFMMVKDGQFNPSNDEDLIVK